MKTVSKGPPQESKILNLARHLREIISIKDHRDQLAEEHVLDLERLLRSVEDEHGMVVDRRVHECCKDCTDYFEAHQCWFCGTSHHDVTAQCRGCGRTPEDK